MAAGSAQRLGVFHVGPFPGGAGRPRLGLRRRPTARTPSPRAQRPLSADNRIRLRTRPPSGMTMTRNGRRAPLARVILLSSRRWTELADELSESRWLVQGDEGVAVVYLDQPSLPEELGEAPAVLRGHHAVAARPAHQGRAA